MIKPLKQQYSFVPCVVYLWLFIYSVFTPYSAMLVLYMHCTESVQKLNALLAILRSNLCKECKILWPTR